MLPDPEVSVIIPVHNAMPYLRECLDSVRGQTIGLDHLEILAVNDGSDDGSGAELDRYAARCPQLTVFHRATASGGASAPRNQALDAARGRYVFFCDADDILGADALRRMVAMAERHGTEMVVGKTVGLGGRKTSVKAFRHEPRADLRYSEVIRSGAPQKLFRRRLLEREKLRFDERFWYGEDQVFVTEAYLAADGISVVGDYDCYYLRMRDDHGNLTSRARGVEDQVGHLERVLEIIQERAADPLIRRRMLGRHFRTLTAVLLHGVRQRDPEDREETEEIWARCRAAYRTHWTPDMASEVSAYQYVALQCLAHDNRDVAEQVAACSPERDRVDDVVEAGRVYRALPGFRAAGGLPDSAYEVTDRLAHPGALTAAEWDGGTLVLSGFFRTGPGTPPLPQCRLVMRHRATRRELVIATEPVGREDPGPDTGRERWRAVFDPGAAGDAACAPHGVWDARLRLLSAETVVAEGRLYWLGPYRGSRRPGARFLALPGAAPDEPTPVVPYVTRKHSLAVDIGGALRPVRRGASLTAVGWHGDRLEIRGSAWATEIPAEELAASIVLRPRARTPQDKRGEPVRRRRGTVAERVAGWFRASPQPSPPAAPPAADPVVVDPVVVDPVVVERLPVPDSSRTGPPDHADPVVWRAAIEAGLPAGVWDVFLRLRQPGAVTDIRLKPAPDCDRAALWRTRLLRTAENAGRSCNPYITKGGYAALDTGAVHFTARTQLAFGPPVPADDESGDFLLRGRVGATGFRPGDLRCEVIRDGNTVHQASVSLAGPSAEGLAAVPGGPEQGTESWPAFVHRLPGGLLAGSPGSLVLRLLIHGTDFERELRL